MAEFERVGIVITEPKLVYYPGYTVQGNLHVDTKIEVKVRGVRIVCCGRSHVHWKEGKKKLQYAHEKYMDSVLVLHGNERDSDEQEAVLSAGSHVFPFQFQLPAHLPASFEGQQQGCYVRYWLKGTVDVAETTVIEAKHVFTVGSMLDLNTVPDAMRPLQEQSCKMVGSGLSKKKPITALLKTNKTAFVPGEAILCSGKIIDGSGKGVKSTDIKLIMKTTYKAFSGQEKCCHTECAKLSRGAISRGGNDVFDDVRLVIPSLPPSLLSGCGIIDISYYIQLELTMSGSTPTLVIPLKIAIGTVPHQSMLQPFLPKPDSPSGRLSTCRKASIDLPPPTYRECVLGKVDTRDLPDDENVTGNTMFVPYYTYYDWIRPAGETHVDVGEEEKQKQVTTIHVKHEIQEETETIQDSAGVALETFDTQL